MAPYEALYSRKYRSLIHWDEAGENRILASMKGVLRFVKNGKLRLRFLGPFKILERIGTVAYRVTLPPELAAVHNVFYGSMLRKYVHNPNHVIHQLRNREVPFVNVQWRNHGLGESTWEKEEEFRIEYPELFD
ncbi:uncharacterized protein LOC111374596 [Olea europaea var. sylvestris]|uniref:uncharacterized protein LOC111374596 n=1 Tax=Olea europaea var. sylvestris TaxID=158386 RepID=UPI000C1D3716|nr:uncharacterized protein LOC111374596 [Olea europaea var. sylvestris]